MDGWIPNLLGFLVKLGVLICYTWHIVSFQRRGIALDIAGGGWKIVRGRYCEEGEGEKRSQYKSSISSENRSRQGGDGDTKLRSDVSTLCGWNEVNMITGWGKGTCYNKPGFNDSSWAARDLTRSEDKSLGKSQSIERDDMIPELDYVQQQFPNE